VDNSAVYVESLADTIPANNWFLMTQACDPGDQVMTGGYFTNQPGGGTGFDLTASFPVSFQGELGWEIQGTNTSNSTIVVSLQVVCISTGSSRRGPSHPTFSGTELGPLE
jgi:hypothetical protein